MANDEDFIQRLQATFRVEAEEHLQNITAMLLEWENSAAAAPRPDIVEAIYREAHSLKGAARAVERADIEAACQTLEDTFSSWKNRDQSPAPADFDAIHRALTSIERMLKPASTDADNEEREALEPLRRSPDSPEVQPAAPLRAAAVATAISSETVRIPVSKLDAHLMNAEDLLPLKAAALARATELGDFVAQLDRWWREWRKVSSEVRALRRKVERSDQAAQPDADPRATALLDFTEWNRDFLHAMEARLAALAARADQDRDDAKRRIDRLLQDSRKLLMLPFSSLSSLFPKIVRDLARDQDKSVDLLVRGDDIEIDKRILDGIKEPIIHILRNCIDHGIESTTQRVNQDKPERATIEIAVSPAQGNKVEIVIADDGAGIDIEGLKASAVARGILSPDAADGLSDHDAADLVFQSSVTTADAVTAISGRGLGMAIARNRIESLGGQIVVQSERGAGTRFFMVLPLTLATFRCVLVTVAGRVFATPTANVERVFRVDRDAIRTVENRESIEYRGRPVALARLAAVLELEAAPADSGNDFETVMLVSAPTGERIAFVVDDVLHEEEVLVKPLPKPLVRIRNVTGAAILGSGKPVIVLNALDLAKSARAGQAVSSPRSSAPPQAVAPQKRILVVEDSITSRMLLKGILESAGYHVTTAIDGIAAITQLREQPVDLVVSDVEMPRMDGFELTSRIRADRHLANLPIVLVTALESREQRERGVEAGADAYIVKSSFQQSDLLEAIDRLL